MDAESKIREIAKRCGNKDVAQSAAYYRFLMHHDPESVWCEIFDGVAFYFGSTAKDHFNLVDIAVVSEMQGRGYGTRLLDRIKRRCEREGVRRITLRARKNSAAERFWRRRGAVRTGESKDGKDRKMEITF